MASYSVNIDFRVIASHKQLVDGLSDVFNAKSGDTVNIDINLNTYSLLYADYLLLIASAITNLRSNGITINGSFSNFKSTSDKTNYASRVNFFEHIGFPFSEGFARHNPLGRFTEIKAFNADNAMELFNEIMKILIDNGVNNDMLTVLNYCLWEVLDNTLNHAGEGFTYGAGSGFVCAQYFPQKHEVRIMIADNGIGIHQALTTHPNSKYKGYSEPEAVLHCIDKGVTNSEGMGFGLWATSEMMSENGGELIIHSGNHQLSCNSEKTVNETLKWKGTYTYLRINTNVSVNHKVIFGESSTIDDDFDEFKDKLLGNIEDLW